MNWFIASFCLRDDLGLHYWCYEFKNYLGNLIKVWKTEGNIGKFTKSEGFVKEFMSRVHSRLENMSFYTESSVSEYFRLSLAVICLLDEETNILDSFNDSLFEKSLKRILDV
ncbi:unnamed protein product [Allacma fusca]|uniref:Uncharacterized protein n=1 Tax=Allacma fusca TaxID=39272 RepID=A0A8J2JEX9_9HEXA|nr:unnamed protein product [Allacma fusca]